jgi:hypothetical protein
LETEHRKWKTTTNIADSKWLQVEVDAFANVSGRREARLRIQSDEWNARPRGTVKSERIAGNFEVNQGNAEFDLRGKPKGKYLGT